MIITSADENNFLKPDASILAEVNADGNFHLIYPLNKFTHYLSKALYGLASCLLS
jgi:hypothetical protein